MLKWQIELADRTIQALREQSPPRSGHPPSARCGSFLELLLMANLQRHPLLTDVCGCGKRPVSTEGCGTSQLSTDGCVNKPVVHRRKLWRTSSRQTKVVAVIVVAGGVVIKQFSLSRSKGQTRGPTNKFVQTLTGFNSSAVIHD